jgi:hypothetical protein
LPRADRLAHNLDNAMARHRINLLVVALASIAVLAATVRLFTGYFERRPTAEEFRVYGAFLSHMAAEAHLPQSNFAKPKAIRL